MANRRQSPGSMHAALDRAIEAAGGARLVAEQLGKSPTTISRWLDPNDELNITTSALQTLSWSSPEFAAAIARHFGAMGELVIFDPARQADNTQTLSDFCLAHGRVTAAFAKIGLTGNGGEMSAALAQQVVADLDAIAVTATALARIARQKSEAE